MAVPTQADIDALDAEIAVIRTAKSTTSGDQSTTYRDLDELLRLRSEMIAQMTAAAGRSRSRVAVFDKGV